MTKPAPPYFPYAHRTLKQVWRDEALAAFNRLPNEHRKGRTVEDYMAGLQRA